MRQNPKIVSLGPGAAYAAAGVTPNRAPITEMAMLLRRSPEFTARHGISDWTDRDLKNNVLGLGYYAYVFALPDAPAGRSAPAARKALKITDDRDDALAAAVVRDKGAGVPGLPKVYEVFALRGVSRYKDPSGSRPPEGANLFAIVVERVRKMERPEDFGEPLQQIEKGLDWLRAHGFDVKDTHNDNMGITDDGRGVIIDFGHKSNISSEHLSPIAVAENPASDAQSVFRDLGSPNVSFSEFSKGVEIEQEHTDDPHEAGRIALDHLREFPDYYARLVKMEARAKKGLPPNPAMQGGERQVEQNARRWYYHTASPANRSSIAKIGLKPGTAASYGPPAVYLWKDQWIAESYYWIEEDEILDVWKVDASGLPVERDPEDPSTAFFTSSAVGPERLRFVGTFSGGKRLTEDEERAAIESGIAVRPFRPVSQNPKIVSLGPSPMYAAAGLTPNPRKADVVDALRWGARWLYEDDEDSFVEGCGDVADTLERFAAAIGYDNVKAVYGSARVPGDIVMHAWLEVDGKVYDPRGDVEKIKYTEHKLSGYGTGPLACGLWFDDDVERMVADFRKMEGRAKKGLPPNPPMQGGERQVEQNARRSNPHVAKYIAYHGTRARFASFSDVPFGMHFGTEKAALERLSSRSLSERAGEPRVIRVELDIARPLRLPDVWDWTPFRVFDALRYGPLKKRKDIPEPWDESPDYLRRVVKYLQGLGYDGIVYKNEHEDKHTDSYIPFAPSQVRIVGESPQVMPNGRRPMSRARRVFDECFDVVEQQFPDFGDCELHQDDRAAFDNGAGAERQFGYCMDGDPMVIAFAGKIESMPDEYIRGLMRHEFGHALDFRYGKELGKMLGRRLPDGIERRADVIAECVFGDTIRYGHLDIQCVGCNGKGKRPGYLQK